jgi:predicted RNA methylase
MAKISKPVLKKHNEALEILKKKDKLNFNEREFVFKHYHEGASKMNNLISAHFTPYSIAKSISQNIRHTDMFVDLCSGIGILSYALKRLNEWDNSPVVGICIENCVEYYEVGKKLLPEFHWICGDIFNPNVIAQVKEIMDGKRFSIVSNPPYGKQVKTDTNSLLKYQGTEFEYKAMELGAILGAEDGAFLIPQESAPFRITGNNYKGVEHESYKTSKYKKFVDQTGLEISPNIGYTTEIFEDEDGWKDVNIKTEIAILEYNELEYQSKSKPVESNEIINEDQLTLF